MVAREFRSDQNNVIFFCSEPDTTILHAGSVKGGEQGFLVERDRKMIVIDDHAQAMPPFPQDVCGNAVDTRRVFEQAARPERYVPNLACIPGGQLFFVAKTVYG